MAVNSGSRKTLWALYETIDWQWWSPIKDGEESELDDLRENLIRLPRTLGRRIAQLIIIDHGKRPDKQVNVQQ